MNRIAAETFALTGVAWGLTAIAVPHWWSSPAYGRMGLSLTLAGALWLLSGALMAFMVAGRPFRASTVIAALAAYASATMMAGVSIVTFTIEQSAVSAIGSGWAFLGLSWPAWRRVWLISQVAPSLVEIGHDAEPNVR